MSRSLKKGPFIEPKLLRKIDLMRERGDKSDSHVEPGIYDFPADGWVHDCGP